MTGLRACGVVLHEIGRWRQKGNGVHLEKLKLLETIKVWKEKIA